MDKLVIAGIPPYDGTHDLDLGEFLGSLTNRELHRIKVMSGVRAGELYEALVAGDSDLIVAFTVIVLERKGRRVDEDLFWDAPAGSAIGLEMGKEEQLPPTEAAADQTLPLKTSGGASSDSTSESQENGLSRIGLPASAKSSHSDRATSAI
jgi:hypothetical protein